MSLQFPTFSQCLNEFNENRSYMRFSSCKNYVLFDYKESVEYDNLWNDVNIWCRGIVFDNNTKEIVFVPFRKFWNLNQKPETQLEVLNQKSGTPRIFSKMDGSMLAVFFDKYSNKLMCCTRGSFESDQAKWAQQWLDENVTDFTPYQDEEWNHIFEVIYKENRIVVPYDFEGLVYLHSTFKNTKFSVMYRRNLEWFDKEPYRVAPQFQFENIGDYIEKSLLIPFTEEGWVLYFDDQTMVKIKGKDYLRVHRLKSDFTDKHIREMLLEHKELKDIVSMFPDEFADEIESKVRPLLDLARAASYRVIATLGGVLREHPSDRKSQALLLREILTGPELSAAFCYLDNKSEQAWKCIVKGI